MGTFDRRFVVRKFKLIELIVLVVCGLAFPLTGHAFKPDTHVWIGQEVLNDVIPDGRVTIGGKEYPVPQHLWRALADYSAQYRMGNIGPDAFPDIMAGQMAVHPGVTEDPPKPPSPWKTDDWLRWLLSADQADPERAAFVHGYIAHAAADLFSHSYVNTYAGDIFFLTDDGEALEQEVELRHWTLEGYIARHNPPLRDHLGASLGPASAVVATPASYIRDRLIFNDEVQAQYQKQGYTQHLAAMHELNKAIARARGKIDEIDGITIPDHLVELNARLAKIEAHLAEVLADIERLHNEILVKTSLVNINLQLIDEKRALIEAKVKEIDALSELINSIQGLVEQRNAIVADWQNKLANTVKETCETFCENWPPGCGSFPRPPCDPLCKLICKLTEAWIEVNNSLQQAILERDAALAELNARIFDKTVAERVRAEAEIALAALEAENRILQEQINLATDLLAQQQAAREQARADALAVRNEITQTHEIQAAHVYVIRIMLEHWQRDMGLATEAYVVAWGDVLRKVMDGTGDPAQPLFGPGGSVTNGVGDSAVKPLTNWLDCWGPVYQGIPKELPNGICRVKQSFDVLLDAISDFQAALGPLNWLIDPAGQLRDIVLQELEPTMVKTALEVTTKIGAPQMTDTIRLVYFGATADTLNQIFANDSSPKGLMLIPDVALRVNGDMHLTPQGHFDPVQYRVARNAVVLAKMALLGPHELNRVAADMAPQAATVYGVELYPEQSIPESTFNILIGVAKSIDGNQQWQQLGLPYHRRGSGFDPQWPWTAADPVNPDTARSFSYGFRNGTAGFRFWEDPVLREVVFRDQTTALFKGPLAPGIEYPSEFGLSRIIQRDYPYPACPQNPFPRTTNIDGTFLTDAAGVRRDNGCDEDLVITAVPVFDKKQLRVEYTVTNEGADRASRSAVAFYLSADTTRDLSDLLLDRHNVPALRTGASFSGSIKAKLPNSLAAGAYFLIAVVDPGSRVAESREDNNAFVAGITVP
ncbi:MAG: CARDB domain-containing protein [Nitrospirota bacterium]